MNQLLMLQLASVLKCFIVHLLKHEKWQHVFKNKIILDDTRLKVHTGSKSNNKESTLTVNLEPKYQEY